MDLDAESAQTYELLLQQRSQLQQALDKVDALLARFEQRIDGKVDDRRRLPATVTPIPGRGGRARPVRMVVLDALEDLEWMALSREIAIYVKARYGREVAATRFSGLAKDEQDAFRSSRARSVYLCHGLVYDTGEPIKRLWGRSDWPLAWRVVAPTTGRVQHLKLTARLCELALTATATAADPELLRFLAADHARDVPGIKVRRGEFALEQWRRIALEAAAELEPRDQLLREAAAERFAAIPLEQQLFGVPDGPPNPVPGPEQASREAGA
jgi:hypothetical protein